MKSVRVHTIVFFLFATALLAQNPPVPKLGTVAGTVTDSSTDQAIVKAVVTLRSDGHGQRDASKTAATDAAGHYEFHDLEPGEYFVTATKAGYVEAGYRSRPRRIAFPVPLTISEGTNLSGIDVKLQRGAVISGHVLNEEGEPLANAQLQALRYQLVQGKKRLMSASWAQSDDRGEYRLHDLPPGDYLVSCHVDQRQTPVANDPHGMRGYPTTFYPGVVSPEAATPVKVTAGNEGVANFSLTLAPAFSIRGKVIGANEEVPTVIMLQPTGDSAFAGYGGSQDLVKDGHFEVKGAMPGTYYVMAINLTEDRQQSASRKVSVSDSDLENITVNFANAASEIQGTLRVLGDQKPDLAKFYVNLEDPTDTETDDEELGNRMFGGRNSLTKKDGTFTLSVATSHRKFVIIYAGGTEFEDYYTKSVTFGARDVTETGFIPAPGASLQVVLSPNGGAIEGLVIDKDGKTVPGAQVFTVPEESRKQRRDLYQTATSDQRGHFRIRGVPPGTFKLLALEDREAQSVFDADFLKAHLSSGTDLKVEEKGKYNVSVTVIPAEPEKPAN